DLSGNVHIFYAAVGAAADEDHVDLLVLAVLGGIHIFHIVRFGNQRYQLGRVDVDDALVVGSFIAFDLAVILLTAHLFEEFTSMFIGFHDRAFRTDVNAHTGDGQTASHAQGRDGVPTEFQGF